MMPGAQVLRWHRTDAKSRKVARPFLRWELWQADKRKARLLFLDVAAMHCFAALAGRNVVLSVLETDIPKSAARRSIAFPGRLDGPALNVRGPTHEGKRCGCEGGDPHRGLTVAACGRRVSVQMPLSREAPAATSASVRVLSRLFRRLFLKMLTAAHEANRL